MDLTEDGATVVLERAESGNQTLLMIGIHARSPYLAHFVRRTIIDGDDIYTGSVPREATKSHTSSCYSCIACIRRDCCYNVAMPMKESMITTGDIASYLYTGSTCPTS